MMDKWRNFKEGIIDHFAGHHQEVRNDLQSRRSGAQGIPSILFVLTSARSSDPPSRTVTEP